VFFINAAMIAPALPLSWLRWFWWRFNVWGEVFGILISVPLSIVVWFVMDWKSRPAWQPTLLLLGIGLVGSVLISLLTRPESDETLRRFYQRIRPPGAWGRIRRGLEADGLLDAAQRRVELKWDLRAAAAGIVFCFAITWAFFTAVMLRWTEAIGWSAVGVVSGWAYYTCWTRSYRASGVLIKPASADDEAIPSPAVTAPAELGSVR
jgi:solute:Na+ symporter, SSS family